MQIQVEPLARLQQYGKGNGDADAVFEALQQAAGANLMVIRNS